MSIFYNAALCSLIDTERRFWGSYCFHHQEDIKIFRRARKSCYNAIINFSITVCPYEISYLKVVLKCTDIRVKDVWVVDENTFHTQYTYTANIIVFEAIKRAALFIPLSRYSMTVWTDFDIISHRMSLTVGPNSSTFFM